MACGESSFAQRPLTYLVDDEMGGEGLEECEGECACVVTTHLPCFGVPLPAQHSQHCFLAGCVPSDGLAKECRWS